MKKLVSLLILVTIFATLFSGCSPAAKEGESPQPPQENSTTTEKSNGDTIVIKVGHTDSSSRSTHTWAVWLGEYLEEKAPGRFKVEVYPDGQLGDSPDLTAGILLGTIQINFDMSSVLTSQAGDASNCIELPYLYPTYEDWITGTFEKGGLELFNETIKDAGYYCFDMYYNGMRQVISTAKNYHNKADLNGQKVRIAQNELNIEMWKAMGANPTPMSWGEVITSLSQGAIDALDHALGVFNDFSLHEIAPYVTLTNHASSPMPVIASLEWVESLAPEDREVLETGIKEMCRQQRDEERAKEAEYIERFKSEGATVYELTPDEKAAFIESVQPVYDMWRKRVGDEMMDKWMATRP